jgi:hypothetical protein
MDAVKPFIVPIVLLAALQVSYVCINFYEFTVITALGRIIQVQIFVFFLYQIAMRLYENVTHFKFPWVPKASREAFEPITDVITSGLRMLEEYYLVKKPIKTLGFIVVLQIVCVLGKIFTGTTLIYLVLNYVLIAPIVYHFQKAQVDNILGLVSSNIEQVYNLVLTKIPPAVMEPLTAFYKKIEG